MNIDNIVNNIITKEKITNEEINLLSNLDYSEQSYIRNLIPIRNLHHEQKTFKLF